jgi:hypothetical protein
MIKICGLFLWESSKPILLFASLGLSLILGARIFGFDPSTVQNIVLFFPILGGLFSTMTVPRNLPWLLQLPLSRFQVLGLHVGINAMIWMQVLFSLLLLLSIAAGLNPTRTDWSDIFSSVAQFTEENPATQTALARVEIPPGFEIALYLLGLLNFGYVLLFSVNRAGLHRQEVFWKRLRLELEGPRRMRVWAGIILLFIALVGLREFWTTSLGYFFMFSLAIVGFCTWNLCQELRLHAPLRRPAMALALAAVFAQALTLGLWARSAGRGPDAKLQVRVQEFMGPFAPHRRSPESILASKLLAPRLPLDFNFVAKLKRAFSPGRLLPRSVPAHFDFPTAVASKADLGELVGTLALFSRSELTDEDLDAFFARWRALDAQAPPQALRRASKLWEVPVSPQDLERRLARTDFAPERAFVLLLARYHRSPGLLRGIQQGIGRWPEETQALALGTLSILSGKRLGLGALERGIRTPASKLTFATLPCPDSFDQSLWDRPEDELNLCTRALLRSRLGAWAFQAEGDGWTQSWWKSPLQPELRKIFGQQLFR